MRPNVILEYSDGELSRQAYFEMRNAFQTCKSKFKAYPEAKLVVNVYHIPNAGPDLTAAAVLAKLSKEPTQIYVDPAGFVQGASAAAKQYIEDIPLSAPAKPKPKTPRALKIQAWRERGTAAVERLTKDTALVFVDFEAFASNPMYPSEIGAVRVQNGVLLAKFHSFIAPAHKVDEKVMGQFYFTKKVTGIPVPWQKQFGLCKPLYHSDDYTKLAHSLQVFCTGSSAELASNAFTSVFSQFPACADYVFIAKGIEMESEIIGEMMEIKTPVCEVAEVHQKLLNKGACFDHIHGGRAFNYCVFHEQAPQKNYHCALDDADFLARMFCQQKTIDIVVE